MQSSLLSQLKALNERLTLNQKLSIVSLSAVILFGVLFFTYLVQREPYQLLFSDLDAASANSVVERLRTLNVSYRLEDSGRSVLVPAERIDELRIEIASQGLPSRGRMGFEIFDQGNWGITDFAEKVNYRRALEGELERTILGLNEVQQARVHLVLGRKSLFRKDEEPAKASVVIRLGAGGALNPKRVGGIRNLVAFAVEGLAPENVTVVDDRGSLLSEPADEERHLSVAQLELRNKVEAGLCEKVTSILAPIVGEDNVRVTASVLLDYSETREKTEQVLDPVMISQQRTEEIVNDLETRGIPFKANAGGADQQETPAEALPQKGRSLQSEVTNYEVSKTLRERLLPSGGVLRQSVAVVVNDRLVIDDEPDGLEPGQVQAQPRDPGEMERIRGLVAATIGLNPERGDSLTVENVPFSIRPDPEIPRLQPGFWQTNKQIIYPAARYLLILVLFGLFYLLIFRPVKRKVFSYVEVERSDLKQLADSLSDPELLSRFEQAQLGEGGERALPSASKLVDRKAALKRDLLTVAKEDPQAMTQLIRSWLSEGV